MSETRKVASVHEFDEAISLSEAVSKTLLFLKSEKQITCTRYHYTLGHHIRLMLKVIIDNPGYLAIAISFVLGFCTFANECVRAIAFNATSNTPPSIAEELNPFALTSIGIFASVAMWLMSSWSFEKYKIRRGRASFYVKATPPWRSILFTLIVPVGSLVLQILAILSFCHPITSAYDVLSGFRPKTMPMPLIIVFLLVTGSSASYSLPSFRINQPKAGTSSK